MKLEITQKKLLEVLLQGNDKEVKEVIENVHPVDILDLIHNNEEDLTKILMRLPDDMIADIIEEEEDEEKYELLKNFSDEKQKNILGEMSSDELTDMVGALDKKESKEILSRIDDEERKDVCKLLKYQRDTAGGIMATEFIAIKEDKSIKETLKYLQEKAPDAESTYYIYVVDKDNILKGVLSLRDIVCTDFHTKISKITNKNVISVKYDLDQEEVAIIFEKYGFLAMPVVNEKNQLLGMVTADDIMEVLKNESTEDIHRLGGVDKEEKVDGTVKESIGSRLPWLLVNLVTAILASAVVGVFEGTISKVVALATFMPIVSGMGGNAGTQSLTIIVRGIALGELTDSNSKKVFLKEVLVGLLSGITLGVIIGFLGYAWEGNAVFGFVIGMAMILNMVAATIAGYIVPVILKKLKIDPALASAVFVTTVTDILGFFFFLGLGTIFINFLI